MPRYIAIDADANGLFVASAVVRGGSVKLEQTFAWVEDGHPLGPASAKALGARLKDLFKKAGVAAAPVLVCVGRERVILKEVRYPPTPPADEPAVVRFQATKDLTESPDEVAVDYFPVPAAAGATERQALVVFLRREILAAARVMCETAGLKLAGVTPRPFALAAVAARAVGRGDLPAPEPADAPVGILSLTERGGEFTVTRGGLVKFSRTIPGPAVTSEQALVAEVRRNLAVYAGYPGGSDVEAIYLTEADAGGEGWFGRLRAGLPVPVYAFDPLADAAAGERIPPTHRGRFAGPVGLLAARAAGPLPINLHQTRQPRASASPNRSRVMIGVLAAVLVLGFGVIGGLLMVNRAQDRVTMLRLQVRQTQDDIDRFELDQKRLSAADDFAAREVVWLDELYDLSARFPDVSKMLVTRLEADALQAPTDKERAKEAEAAKANPLLARNVPPKPVAKLRIEVATDDPTLPNKLVVSLNAESRYYLNTKPSGGALLPGYRQTTQRFVIETQLARRLPADYKRRLTVSTPPAVNLAPAARRPIDAPTPFDPEFGGGIDP